MEGTHVDQGKQILADSGLKIAIAHDLAEAAQKVVKMAQQGA
jgi:succinyl-CoA synthetase beta subunit